METLDKAAPNVHKFHSHSTKLDLLVHMERYIIWEMLVLTNIMMISIQNWTGVEEKTKLKKTALKTSIFQNSTRVIIKNASEKNIVLSIHHNSLKSSSNYKTHNPTCNAITVSQYCFCNMSADRMSSSSIWNGKTHQ